MKQQRSIESIREQKARTLFVRLPHTIKSKEQVEALFTGNFQVKLTRKKGRFCHVVFDSLKESQRNLKAARSKKVNGRRVVIAPAHPLIARQPDLKKKKVVLPQIKDDVKITKVLFVSNIQCGTKVQDLKEAIVGATSVKLLKPYTQELRCAMVRMNSAMLAAEYLTKVRPWPVVNGRKLMIYSDTRKKNPKSKKSDSIKIYDGETEMKVDASESDEDVDESEESEDSGESEESEDSGESEESDDGDSVDDM